MCKKNILKNENYRELAEFLTTVTKLKDADVHENLFRFWWDDNPVFNEDKIRGWLLRDGEKIIGFIGSVPTGFSVNGKDQVIENITTWFLDADYRDRGLGGILWKSLSDYSSKTLLFCTTPTPQVVSIMEKLNFKLLPRGGDEGYKLSFCMLSGLSEKLQLNRLPLATPLVKYVDNTFLRFQLLKMQKSVGKYTVKRVKHADLKFDDLWQASKHRFAYTNIRSSEIVNWICTRKSLDNRILLGAYDKNSNLVGYSIFMEQETHGTIMLENLDVFYREGSHDSVVEMMNYAIKIAAKSGYAKIILPHFSQDLDKIYSRMNWLTTTRNQPPYYANIPDEGYNITTDNSYLVGLQGDYGLVL